jgi:tellurite resistance protein
MFRPTLTSTPLPGDTGVICGIIGPGAPKLAITFRLRAENAMQTQLTPQEALIYAMVTVAAVDREITRVELDRINGMVRELPALRGIEDTWLSNEAQSCGRILAKPDGVATVVAMIVAALPANLRETAYALAAEVAASDLAIKDDERDFLALLAKGLELNPLVRAALECSASARHRTA